MFNSKEIELALNLLQSILERDSQEALNKSRMLLEEIFMKKFSEAVESNGVLRYNSLLGQEDNIKYWGLLYEGARTSGPYENFSLVVFPDNTDSPKQLLLCFGLGTGGVTNEEASLLSTPVVKRSINSLLKLIKRKNWLIGGTKIFVKDDIIDESASLPNEVTNELGNFFDYDSLWKKYGKYLPSVCVIEKNENGAMALLNHILLYGKFRGWSFRKKYLNLIENQLIPNLIEVWRDYPKIDWLVPYLQQRKYIILQGPPGTGKTYLAELMAQKVKENGVVTDYETIQFHSSITYEDFVEGIKPDTTNNQLVFKENIGPFVRNIEKTNESGNGYLLVIDELNRGDLAKILGEAIFLLEPGQGRKITIRSGKHLKMPDNFYLIGTMNTADRSIAILDFAIRRRFAFIDVWPSAEQLKQIYNNKNLKVQEKALEYYNRLQNIFFNKAIESDLNLQPGHTYFFAESIDALKAKMKYEVAPLIKEYLAEGKLAFAKNELHAIIEEFEEV